MSEMTRNEAMRRMKAALKRRSGKEWSVTGGKGTAYGWITINAPPKRRTWRNVQTETSIPPCDDAIYRGMDGITPYPYVRDMFTNDPDVYRITCYEDDPWARAAVERGVRFKFNWEVEAPSYEYGHMSPEDRVELARLLDLDRPVHPQGHSVPSGSDYRDEYLARCEGRMPESRGVRYWD